LELIDHLFERRQLPLSVRFVQLSVFKLRLRLIDCLYELLLCLALSYRRYF